MKEDPRLTALRADIHAARERLFAQRAADPDHEVAIAMYQADLNRAEHALLLFQVSQPRSRTYVDGKRVA